MLNFVIIGCGRISYKIVDGIVNNKEKARLVGVSDIVFSKMDEIEFEYQNKINSKETIVKKENYKELLESISVDVAIISTESGYHEEIGLYFLENGVNVIIEKPLAMSIEGARKLVDTAKKNNLKLAVSHQNRFNYPIQLLKKAIKENRLGKIFNGMARILWTRDDNYYLQAPWRGTWALDGGTLMNQCIHNIDLINWMMDDEINLEETLTITGEKGTVVIGGMAVNKINTWRVEGDNEEEYLSIDCGDPNSVYGYGHEALYKDFIDALDENREPLVDGKAGLEAVKIILAAYKSQKTGIPVKFDEFKEFSTLNMKENNIKDR